MKRFTFQYGGIRAEWSAPDCAVIETIPGFMMETPGDFAPASAFEISISLNQSPGELLPRRFELPEGSFQCEGDRWNFSLRLLSGSQRADYWPRRVYIPLLHFLLYRRGLLPVHASLFEKDGRGILAVGKSGAGKSTLVELAHDRGLRVIADDRALVWRDGNIIRASASFERPSPFHRWTKRDPLKDLPRIKIEPVHGISMPVSEILFPEVVSGAPSALLELSAAETSARFSVLGAGEVSAGWKLPPGRSLTLGTGLDRLFGLEFAESR